MQLVASYGYGRQKARNRAHPSPGASGDRVGETPRALLLLNNLDAYLAADFSLMAWASSSLTHIKIWDFSTVKT